MKWQCDAQLPIQFAAIEIADVTISQDRFAFEHLMDYAALYRRKYGTSAIRDIPGVQAARIFFRAIGIDPTKRRPSSEALLRRVLKEKPLYSVNTLVDVGNWCSLDFLLPTCAYDAQKIAGDATIRQGKEGESYVALNRRAINLYQRYLLADTQGPFGSPMTDSQRTAVTLETRQVVLGIWAARAYDSQRLRQQADIFANRVKEICAGEIQSITLLNGTYTERVNNI